MLAARLKQLLQGEATVDDAAALGSARKVLLRCQVTEFEFKGGRHALRGKKKKTMLQDRTRLPICLLVAQMASSVRYGSSLPFEMCWSQLTLPKSRLYRPRLASTSDRSNV